MITTAMHMYAAGCLAWLSFIGIGWQWLPRQDRETMLYLTFGWPVVGLINLFIAVWNLVDHQ